MRHVFVGELAWRLWTVPQPGNCMLAIDVKSGKLLWYFQFTPHDLHDWDATEPPLLMPATGATENNYSGVLSKQAEPSPPSLPGGLTLHM